MIQPIQTTFSQPVDFIPQVRKPNANNNPLSNEITPSSSRSAMRRMRAETTTPSWAPLTTDYTKTEKTDSFTAIMNNLNAFQIAFEQGLKNKNYPEILEMLSLAEGRWDHFIHDAEQVLEILANDQLNILAKGQLKIVQAYIHGMMQHPEAISLCDAGAEKIKYAYSKMRELAHEQGWEFGRSSNFSEHFDSVHLGYRGFLELSVGQREEAILDLRKSLASLNFQVDSYDQPFAEPQALFFIKILEQKLNASLLSIPLAIDASNPLALFAAGQYKQALALLDTTHTACADFDLKQLKAYCLAMLGKIEEAGEYLEADPTYLLLDFLQGDYEKINTPELNWNGSPVVLFMLPLAVTGLAHS